MMKVVTGSSESIDYPNGWTFLLAIMNWFVVCSREGAERWRYEWGSYHHCDEAHHRTFSFLLVWVAKF